MAAAPGHVAAVREAMFDRLDDDQVTALRLVFEQLTEDGPAGDAG